MNIIAQAASTDYNPTTFFMLLVAGFVCYTISSGLTVRIIKKHVAEQETQQARSSITGGTHHTSSPDPTKPVTYPGKLQAKQLTIPLIFSAIGTILFFSAFIFG